MVEGKSDSAITKHVNLSPDCLESVCSNVLSHFSVVARARSNSHLNVLEAIFIAKLKYALNGMLKSIPIPSNRTFKLKLLEMTEKLIKRMRRKAFFFMKSDAEK